MDIQTGKEQLKQQQSVLKALGFYFGPIDGIWGPESIKAKQKMEASPSFVPGIPNNGMPFAGHPPYPAGITIQNGLIQHAALNSTQKPEETTEDVEVEDIPTEQSSSNRIDLKGKNKNR